MPDQPPEGTGRQRDSSAVRHRMSPARRAHTRRARRLRPVEGRSSSVECRIFERPPWSLAIRHFSLVGTHKHPVNCYVPSSEQRKIVPYATFRNRHRNHTLDHRTGPELTHSVTHAVRILPGSGARPMRKSSLRRFRVLTESCTRMPSRRTSVAAYHPFSMLPILKDRMFFSNRTALRL